MYDNTVKQEGDNLIAVQSGGARSELIKILWKYKTTNSFQQVTNRSFEVLSFLKRLRINVYLLCLHSLLSFSAKVTGKIKSKWVNAFKNVKGSQPANTVSPGVQTKAAAVGPPPVLETSHQFAEYTYKNITSCDVCSQIMKGSTRQGHKCKLCRMNVHIECQDKVVKCQPKAKFSRMKSGSEMGDEESKIIW